MPAKYKRFNTLPPGSSGKSRLGIRCNLPTVARGITYLRYSAGPTTTQCLSNMVEPGAQNPPAMIATRDTLIVRRRSDVLRWGACVAVALFIHIAGAVALLARWNDPPDAVANAPVIMIELAAVPVAPDAAQSRLPPGPQQPETRPQPDQPKTVEKAEIKTELVKEAELPATQTKPADKPTEKKLIQRQASLASAPSTARQRAERAAARAPGSVSHNSDAVPNWKSALVARLERYKRYPPEAQSRSETGVTQLAFSVDRSGGVHHAHVVRSSGSNVLDREAVALAERASPMPPPPAEITGAQIPIQVPIRYNAR
jgi:periplasmic protein TonB